MPEAEPLPRAGRRMVLRRLTPADLSTFQHYRLDPETGKYQSWTPMSDREARDFLAKMSVAGLFLPGEWVQLGIAERGTDTLIGDVGICVASCEEEAEIGITLCPRFQGLGLGTEAMGEAIRLVFEETPARRILAVTDARNLRCIHMLERAGMRKVETRSSLFRGEPCTEHVYSISREGSI